MPGKTSSVDPIELVQFTCFLTQEIKRQLSCSQLTNMIEKDELVDLPSKCLQTWISMNPTTKIKYNSTRIVTANKSRAQLAKGANTGAKRRPKVKADKIVHATDNNGKTQQSLTKYLTKKAKAPRGPAMQVEPLDLTFQKQVQVQKTNSPNKVSECLQRSILDYLIKKQIKLEC